MTGIGVEAGAQAARSRALAVLRVRGRALAVAVLPAAAAVILLAGGSSGHLAGSGWDVARWVVSALALVVLLVAAGIGLVVARARPAMSPTVPISEGSAPDLYRMVRDLADRLDVPVPSAIALTPDCDSWLEDRTHPAHGPPPRASADELAGPGRRHHRRTAAAPVLVIGSPFLWWMRVGELRAVLAPVVAGTGPSAHPDIAAARRFVRGLDAAVAVTSAPGRGPLSRTVLGGVGWVARLLLRGCRGHAAEMERGVAAAAAERAQAVDYGLRIVAQEQVGLAYAGWDRLLTRVALPAWRMGRWPSRLDAGVVAALTELSRRDRLAEGFASRLGERPACDLLEEPGAVDEAASLLAARLFHGGPAEAGPDWSPVDWQEYPEEVVDRKWRTDAARLHRVLDSLGVRPAPAPAAPYGPTLSRVLDHLSSAPATSASRIDGDGHAEDAPGTDGYQGAAAQTDGRQQASAEMDDRRGWTDAETDGCERAGTQMAGTQMDGTDTAGRNRAAAETDGPEPGRAAPHKEGPGWMGAEPEVAERASGVPDAREAVGAQPETDDSEQATAEADAREGTGSATAGPGRPAPDTAGPGELHAETDRRNRQNPEADRGESTAPDADRPERPAPGTAPAPDPFADAPMDAGDPLNERSATLAARLSAEVAREEAAGAGGPAPSTGPGGAAGQGPDTARWDDGALPLFPLQPPRTARELLADHVTAMVCCAAVDTAGASPGLDWLDGPSLLVNGERAADLSSRVLSLIEEGDPAPLRAWLVESGIRPEKPVRLV
ncbi:hypothetical protein [Streptomyces sp. NPDC051636]|uniref:hypothetical protein n=1 Tax=Streptomyces sp. NPDC051636 TaxID=3365663 RepID=UPI0037A8E3DB